MSFCRNGYHFGIFPCIYCPRHPVWEASVGDQWRLMRPKAPRVEDECERQVSETSVGDKWATNVNSCGPRQPEWETSVGDKS